MALCLKLGNQLIGFKFAVSNAEFETNVKLYQFSQSFFLCPTVPVNY